MKPAYSVLFLTTLIGAGQGLFIALVTGQAYLVLGATDVRESGMFYAVGSLVALALLGGGLLASIFHLAHPERGMRAFSRWRTSWLSREVILLPVVMGSVALYGLLHLIGWDPVLMVFGNGNALDLTLAVGTLGAALAGLLYIVTGMIYACVRFIREWATQTTVINFTLMGLSSGFAVAAAYAATMTSLFTALFAGAAVLFTIAALLGRAHAVWRNARLGPPVTMKTAIGVHHQQVRQISRGFLGGSFNTTEYFHGHAADLPRRLVPVYLALGFVIPVGLLFAGWFGEATPPLYLAVAVQYVGLMVERWAFFAGGNHVQNIYYQSMA